MTDHTDELPAISKAEIVIGSYPDPSSPDGRGVLIIKGPQLYSKIANGHTLSSGLSVVLGSTLTTLSGRSRWAPPESDEARRYFLLAPSRPPRMHAGLLAAPRQLADENEGRRLRQSVQAMTANVIAFPIDAVAQEHGTLHGGSPSGSQVRRSSTRDRRCWPLFERLAAESASVEAFDIAIAAFLKERERSGPKHPGRPALDRLARLYIRHFRREIVSQHRFFEVARQALMASAGCGRMIRRPFIHMDV